MKCHLTLLLATGLVSLGQAQTVEIQGKAKVTQMDQDDQSKQVVVRQDDGTLAVQSAAAIASPYDTSRNLATDIALLKLLCQCQSLPPLMIQRLLDLGYTENDLLQAGAAWEDIQGGMPVFDGDGNQYIPIQIGEQVWLRENMRSKSYNDGTPINQSRSSGEWNTASGIDEPTFAWYDYDSATFEQSNFGAIYNYHVIDAGPALNICPVGYHVPTEEELDSLLSFLGSDPGRKLKVPGIEGWEAPNGTDNFGFSAYGAGVISDTGSDQFFRQASFLWSSSVAAGASPALNLTSGSNSATNLNIAVDNGLSIRCIKDE